MKALLKLIDVLQRREKSTDLNLHLEAATGCFLKKSGLKNFAKFTGQPLSRSLAPKQVFSCEMAASVHHHLTRQIYVQSEKKKHEINVLNDVLDMFKVNNKDTKTKLFKLSSHSLVLSI